MPPNMWGGPPMDMAGNQMMGIPDRKDSRDRKRRRRSRSRSSRSRSRDGHRNNNRHNNNRDSGSNRDRSRQTNNSFSDRRGSQQNGNFGKHDKEKQERFLDRRQRGIDANNSRFKPSKGDWKCDKSDCQNWNFAKRDVCNLCKAPKPANAFTYEGSDDEEGSNHNRKNSGGSNGRRDNRRDNRSDNRNDNRQNNYNNNNNQNRDRSNNNNQNNQGNNRGYQQRNPREQRNAPKFKEGDWICRECGNLNFGWRESCNICKGNKPEGSTNNPPNADGEFDGRGRSNNRGSGGGGNDRRNSGNDRNNRKHSGDSKGFIFDLFFWVF